MRSITVSAPGKLMLLGDHAVVHEYSCLVTAVDYRVFAEVSISEKDEYIIPSGNGIHFLDALLKVFRKKTQIQQPVTIKTWAGYDFSYGLGSSSAVTVSTVSALSALFNRPFSPKELFDICYQAVLSVQGVGSGFDIAAAIWGGTLLFFTGGKRIEPQQISTFPLIVGYSGEKGDTATLVKGVYKMREKKKDYVDGIFDESERLVQVGKKLLGQNDFKELGLLMNENHFILQKLGVSTKKLDDMVSAAREAGAYGAKLSGAGGGDCMIALAPENRREHIEKAIERVGGTIIQVNTNAEGVRVES